MQQLPFVVVVLAGSLVVQPVEGKMALVDGTLWGAAATLAVHGASGERAPWGGPLGRVEGGPGEVRGRGGPAGGQCSVSCSRLPAAACPRHCWCGSGRRRQGSRQTELARTASV